MTTIIIIIIIIIIIWDSPFLRLVLYFRFKTRILKEWDVQKPDCFGLIVSKQHLIEAAVRRGFSKQLILKIQEY